VARTELDLLGLGVSFVLFLRQASHQ
jgi:hypothetical protein